MSDLARLPSLNALRAFVVAGRHLNLNSAAKELFVTPSALSHQIRALEEALGTPLFKRTRQGLALTAAGQAILPGLTAAFEQMTDAMAQLRKRPDSQVLTISMLSTFAMRWFIPRLARFQQLQPEINVRISTSVELVNFEREDIDCAIRFGAGQWPNLTAIRLFTEKLAPVCSPTLAIAERPLASPADLAGQTLLHARLRPDDWRIWLSSVGLADLRPAYEQTYETRNFAIQAAVDGLGVAIIDPSLAAGDIRAGRLVQPFAQTLTGENAYYLVYPERLAGDARIAALEAWLLDEAAKSD